MNDLTNEHCAEFDRYVVKWQKILNLSDWRIERSGRRSKRSMAEISFDRNARLACYQIGVSFGGASVTPESLEVTALHELLHVLLHDLIYAEPAALEGAEHRVINVLEKLLIRGSHAA
jgi:hypothetical protein